MYYQNYNKNAPKKEAGKGYSEKGKPKKKYNNTVSAVVSSAGSAGRIAQRSYTEGFKACESYYKEILRKNNIKL